MTLEELKQEAELEAVGIELNWDELSDPQEAAYFTATLSKGMRMIPDLEYLYTKLSSGKSVIEPEQNTALSYDDVENYRELIENELHAAYLIRAVYDKFEKVNSIIALAQKDEL